MRRLFTTEDARRHSVGLEALRWGEQKGRWRGIVRSVYGVGPDSPTALDTGRAVVLASGGVASSHLAGVLYGLDSVELRGPDVTVPRGSSNCLPGVRRRNLDLGRIVAVDGVPCTDGLQTMIDLAVSLDDLKWEQALESALRNKIVAVTELEQVPGAHARSGSHPASARATPTRCAADREPA